MAKVTRGRGHETDALMLGARFYSGAVFCLAVHTGSLRARIADAYGNHAAWANDLIGLLPLGIAERMVALRAELTSAAPDPAGPASEEVIGRSITACDQRELELLAQRIFFLADDLAQAVVEARLAERNGRRPVGVAAGPGAGGGSTLDGPDGRGDRSRGCNTY